MDRPNIRETLVASQDMLSGSPNARSNSTWDKDIFSAPAIFPFGDRVQEHLKVPQRPFPGKSQQRFL